MRTNSILKPRATKGSTFKLYSNGNLTSLTTEIKFDLVISEIPAEHHLEAQRKAKEAYVMALLKYGDISTGRAALILDIPRVELIDSMGSYGISLFDEMMTREVALLQKTSLADSCCSSLVNVQA